LNVLIVGEADLSQLLLAEFKGNTNAQDVMGLEKLDQNKQKI
jgi:hypothetical protein